MRAKAWTTVILLGVFGKLFAKLLAPVAVLFVNRKTHPVWGVRDATDLSWWNTGVRNGAHNFFSRPTPAFSTTGNTDDETLERLEGFQWRRRQSADGKYVSFRCTWGKPRNKGKREFYVGWTMNEKAYMRLTFFQLRLF
jgi:hypothetical protein